MIDFSVFHIEGGIGKHVLATAVVATHKEKYPDRKIIVSCAWPEVFLSNPDIYRVYRIGNQPYFYQDFIHNKNVEIFAQEPYKTTSHIKKQKHIVESWCDLIGSPWNGNTPNLYFNFREVEVAGKLIKSVDGKPILIFQPFGGPGKNHQTYPYSWTRDIHPNVAQLLANELSQKYTIYHICYEFHPVLQNCIRIDQQMEKKVLFATLKYSSARLLVDSSLQHAAAAMGLSSTVVWVATHPDVFGYDIHTNITPKNIHFEGTVDSYLYDFNFTGAIHECPYTTHTEIFDVDQILKSL